MVPIPSPLPADTDGDRAADQRVWGLVAGYCLFSAMAFHAAGLRIQFGTAWALGGMTVVGAAVSGAAMGRLPNSRIIRIVGALHLQMLCGLGSAMLVFTAATTCRPLVDARLLAADRALGFDWQSYIAFVVAHPALEQALSAAYDTLFWQMMLVIVSLGVSRDRGRLRQFNVAHVVVLAMTMVLFALWPVTTAWVHLDIDPITLQSLHLRQGGWPQQLLDLRAGLVSEITPASNFALVGFPSYHAAAGLLNVWAAWPHRWLRWPVVSVSVVMTAATPTDGGHYLVDLFGAAAVVVIGVRLSAMFLAWPLAGWRGLGRVRLSFRPAAVP